MADNFQGSNLIEIQPGDTNVPYQFGFSVASSSGRADGSFPFGSTLSSITCDAHRVDGVAVSTGNMVQATSDFNYDGNNVVIPLTYSTELMSTELGAGRYHLEIMATVVIQGNTSDLFIKQFDFDRVEVKS